MSDKAQYRLRLHACSVVTKGVQKGSGRIVALKKLLTHNVRDGVSEFLDGEYEV